MRVKSETEEVLRLPWKKEEGVETRKEERRRRGELDRIPRWNTEEDGEPITSRREDVPARDRILDENSRPWGSPGWYALR
ncbi:hypothetical protein NDU88_002513 [Pleurodeles waltl]|uniref:Uncharacterized protein n=1 Tax=Pleurodeles waltl TaxID=8319 RepID=A0AAV7NHX2_PLEWA|nr:hypothetical protein NDU88_002513 [Pleurodeles waltl]